jgi:hypothetical protein
MVLVRASIALFGVYGRLAVAVLSLLAAAGERFDFLDLVIVECCGRVFAALVGAGYDELAAVTHRHSAGGRSPKPRLTAECASVRSGERLSLAATWKSNASG